MENKFQIINQGTMPFLSVVIPVYQSQESLRELHERLDKSLSIISANFEIILVNDASTDNSWSIIVELAHKDERVRGINLSRNFGQHYAITAGFDHVRGDWVIVMDCDLQDIPEEIPKLYFAVQEGYDMVVGLRTDRQDTYFKKLGSRVFFKLFSFFTKSNINHRVGNFGIYSRKVIESISMLREHNRSFGLFALWVGFKRKEIDIAHAERPYGQTSYTFRRLVRFAIDNIVSHSNRLLAFSANLGLFMSFSSLMYGFWLALRHYLFAIPVEGWTSLMVSIYFTAGLIIGSVGTLGIYVGKIFDEVKRRPLYLIESKTFSEIPPNSALSQFTRSTDV